LLDRDLPQQVTVVRGALGNQAGRGSMGGPRHRFIR
jgi:hypothetical protein